MDILNKINGPEDVRALDSRQVKILCDELREFLISEVSRTGGHLASNLGVVELTVALHRVFDTSRDRLVFDVGHQCYVHKILTERRDRFDTLRSFGGLSGFPKPYESVHDAFVTGHASTSVSVALGMARARTLQKEDYCVVAVIGDGAMTGGMAYEGLNDAGQSGIPLIVILNDNGMSITDNVGGISMHLARLRNRASYYQFKKAYRKAMSVLPGGRRIYRFTHKVKTAVKNAVLPCSMFEDMGFSYLGPVDGHDVDRLTYLLGWAKYLKRPVLLHINTVKGKGYKFSEDHPNEYHGVSKFNIENGKEITNGGPTFSDAFGKAIDRFAEKDQRVCVITAAMSSGTGLDLFALKHPQRFFDVGIAEEHAAAMAAGMAKQGLLPVFAVYSTFLQRSYDALIHDVAIQNLHVVFCVDRAGLIGQDGETHQGTFDVAFLCQVPKMRVFCPSNFSELDSMLERALFGAAGPAAVRYPRGGERGFRTDTSGADALVLREGSDITIVAYGILINNALEAARELAKKGIEAEIVKLNAINPIDFDLILSSVGKTGRLMVIEDCIFEGSVGQRILSQTAKKGRQVKDVILRNTGDSFVPHGTIADLYRLCGLDGDSICRAVTEVMQSER